MWLSSMFARRRLSRPARAKSTSSRLAIEALEDRTVPSSSAALGDFNNDGLIDRVEVTRSTDQVQVFLAQADGTYRAARAAKTGYGPHDVVVGDFNNDGNLDALTANGNNISLLLGRGDGTFRKASNFLGHSFGSLAVGDLNHDGYLDLVGAVSQKGYLYSYSSIEAYLSHGGRSFSFASTTDLRVLTELGRLEDVNGDGNLDVLTSGGSLLLYGNGDGTFDKPLWWW